MRGEEERGERREELRHITRHRGIIKCIITPDEYKEVVFNNSADGWVFNPVSTSVHSYAVWVSVCLCVCVREEQGNLWEVFRSFQAYDL